MRERLGGEVAARVERQRRRREFASRRAGSRSGRARSPPRPSGSSSPPRAPSRAADVDVRDHLGLGDAAPHRHRPERIEVADDQVDRLDPRGGQRAHVVVVVAAGEDGRVERRVERLHAAAEELRRPGQLLDASSPRRRHRPGTAAVPDVEMISTPSSRSPDASVVRPFLSLTEMRARLMLTRLPHAHIPPSTSIRPAQNSRTACGNNRCSTSWMRLELHGVAIIRNLDRLLLEIGPLSTTCSSSTMWTVTPVTRTPCASASRPRVGAGKRGQQRGVHVHDPARRTGAGTPATGSACSRPARPARRRGDRGTPPSRPRRLVAIAGMPAALGPGQRRLPRRGSRRRRPRRCRARRSAPGGWCPPRDEDADPQRSVTPSPSTTLPRQPRRLAGPLERRQGATSAALALQPRRRTRGRG